MKAKGKVVSGTEMLDCFGGTGVECHLKADSNVSAIGFPVSITLTCAHPLPAFVFWCNFDPGISSITMEPPTNRRVPTKNDQSKPQRSE